MGQLPELAHRGAELGDGLVEDPRDVHAASEAALGQPQGHPQRHQPLLGPVVQVALEADPLLVADPQQPGPAVLGLGERLAQLERGVGPARPGARPGRRWRARAPGDTGTPTDRSADALRARG